MEAMAIGGVRHRGQAKGYVYVRAEYPIAVQRLEVAIEPGPGAAGCWANTSWASAFDFDIRDPPGRRRVRLRRGDGADERASRASGASPGRGPPFPAVKGLFGKAERC